LEPFQDPIANSYKETKCTTAHIPGLLQAVQYKVAELDKFYESKPLLLLRKLRLGTGIPIKTAVSCSRRILLNNTHVIWYGSSVGSFMVFYATFHNISVISWRLTQVHFVNTKQNKHKRTNRTKFICGSR